MLNYLGFLNYNSFWPNPLLDSKYFMYRSTAFLVKQHSVKTFASTKINKKNV